MSWCVAVAAAHFHPDEGQVLEFVHPAGALTGAEARDVAFCAFPDSVSSLEDAQSRTSVRDSTFFFRIRRSAADGTGATAAASTTPTHGSPIVQSLSNSPSIVPSERLAADAAAATQAAAAQPRPSTSSPSRYTGAPSPAGFLYGWVFCRQRRDARVKRGAEQRAVVVLADAPYSSALAALAPAVGAAYFNAGPAGLVAAWAEVASWPSPPQCVDAPECVTACGAAFTVQAPPATVLPPPLPPPCAASPPLNPAAPLPRLTGPGGRPAPPSTFHDTCAWTALAGLLPHAWHLWEVTLLASPTLVLGRTPGACGSAVAALISLIAPLPYSADFRPYLTIHDAAATALVEAGGAGAAPARVAGHLPRLVGATNPFFVRALGGAWPTVVSVGGRGGGGALGGGGATAMPSVAASYADRAGAPPDGPAGGGRSMLAPTATSPSRLQRAASAGAALAGAAASALRTAAASARRGGGGPGGGGGLAGHPAAAAALASGRAPPAVWSAVPRSARLDRVFLASLHPAPPAPPPPGSPAAEATAAAAASNSAALRSHFWRLTSALLSLFDEAFAAPGPPPGDGPLPPGGPPPPPPFSHTEFLARVVGGPLSPARGGGGGGEAGHKQAPAPPLLPIPPDLLARFGGSRSTLASFLRRFLASPNFSAWFERRRAVGRAWQAAEWEAAGLARGEGFKPFEEMSEVELMESWSRVEARLAAAAAAAAPPATVQLLSAHAQRVYGAMPPDLQAALLSAPARAEMWHTAFALSPRVANSAMPCLDPYRLAVQPGRRAAPARGVAGTGKPRRIGCSAQKPDQASAGFRLLERAGGFLLPQAALVTTARTAWRAAWAAMVTELAPQDAGGAYARPPSSFPLAGGPASFGGPAWPLTGPGRYRLYLGNACPWCHRVGVAAFLRGWAVYCQPSPSDYLSLCRLADDPARARRGGWVVEAGAGGGSQAGDALTGSPDLKGVYDALSPTQPYTGRCTAPLLVDGSTRRIVTNDSASILCALDAAAVPGVTTPIRLRPPGLVPAIDALNDDLYASVCNGVYRCGFATGQGAYERAVAGVQAGLDRAESILTSNRFLAGDRVTDADVRLFPTVVRLDAAYGPLFRATRTPLADGWPNLAAWAADLWRLQVGGTGLALGPATVDVEAARASYYGSLFPLNPSGILPVQPAGVAWFGGAGGAAAADGRGGGDLETVFHLRDG